MQDPQTQSVPVSPPVAVAQALRFYSRLPVPRLPFEADPHALPDFGRIAWAVPVAGLVIGAVGALVGAGAMLAGLSPMIAAALTLATLVIVTGCFHEDGLADACDGLWGGMTPERRLEIMKDSRIGAYGAAGMALSLLIRFAALAELFRLMGPFAGIAVIGIASCSRGLALVPCALLQPARMNGLAALAPMPALSAAGLAVLVGAGALALSAMLLDLATLLVVAPLPLVVTLAISISLMRRKIGGFTGDLLGATQQVSEITLLLCLAATAAARGPL